MRRIEIQGQPGQIVHETPPQKSQEQNRQKKKKSKV
jgi:hypothetical protein